MPTASMRRLLTFTHKASFCSDLAATAQLQHLVR